MLPHRVAREPRARLVEVGTGGKHLALAAEDKRPDTAAACLFDSGDEVPQHLAGQRIRLVGPRKAEVQEFAVTLYPNQIIIALK